MPISTITSKGQITLPKEVREHLHLAEGDRVEFVIEEGGAVHVRPVAGSVEELFGLLRRPGTHSHTVEEMDRTVAQALAEDDRRIRRGE